jgi:hypothetical protein
MHQKTDHLLVQSHVVVYNRKSGVSAVNLHELLGLGSYHIAWTWLTEVTGLHHLQGIAKNYPAVLRSMNSSSAAKSLCKHGRGADGKTIVLVAVEKDTVQDTVILYHFCKMGRVRLQVTLDISAFSLETFFHHNIEKKQHGCHRQN